MFPISREAARIFRITHVDNLPWILEHGLHCRSSDTLDPNFREIGNADIIRGRTARTVGIAPGGTLSDYIPFYFSSRTPMLMNIATGQGVPRIPKSEIAILVSDLPRLERQAISFVFSDRHAGLLSARFCSGLADLGVVDWDILRRSDFRSDEMDREKKERYQAEALVYKHVPIDALSGIIASEVSVTTHVETLIRSSGHVLPVATRPDCFV